MRRLDWESELMLRVYPSTNIATTAHFKEVLCSLASLLGHIFALQHLGPSLSGHLYASEELNNG